MEKQDTELQNRLQEMNLEENQGGDLTSNDILLYCLLGIVFPLALLIWGWF